MNKIKKTLVGLTMALTPYLANAQSPIWKDVELITPQEAQSKYGTNIPNDVYTSINDFIDATNIAVEPLRANIGAGLFESDRVNVGYKPLAIIGKSAKETTLDAIIVCADYMDLENITSNGDTELDSGGFPITIFAGFYGGGRLENCDLYNTGVVTLDPSKDFTLINNTFTGVHSSQQNVAVAFIGLNSPDIKGNIKIADNDFYNIEKVFYLTSNASYSTALVANSGSMIFTSS